MAPPTIYSPSAGAHNIYTQLEHFEAESHGFSSLAPDSLGDHAQLKSFLQLSQFTQFDIVKQSWRETIRNVSKSVEAPALDEAYQTDSVTIVQVSGDKGLLATPPSSPQKSLQLAGPLVTNTIITFHCAENAQNVLDFHLPENTTSLISQSTVRLKVVYSIDQWQIHFYYKRDSLSPTQAEEIVGIFEQCLEEAIEAIASKTPPSPPAETDLEFSNDCPKVDRCIHDLIEEQSVARPDHEAIFAYDGSLSYAQLSNVSSILAEKLKILEARREQRVAILMNKSTWYSVAVLAVLKSGAAFVPLDPSHPENRLKQLVADIEPCALITTSSLSEKAAGLECPRLLAIDQTDLTCDETMTLPFSLPTASPDNAAYMIFTSGSTGKPKGVVIEHAALCTSAITRGAVLGLGPDSRVLQYAPHTFDVSVDEILTTLIHGGCVCDPSENDRFAIAPFINSARVTAALLTPTSARTLHPDDVSTLRSLQTGGEVLTEDVNDKWSDRVTLFNVYGPTEASVACVISNRTGLKGTGHVLGHAVGGKLWIVDPDDVERRLPDNEVGELVIAGRILARGYFRDPERTESSFVRLQSGERVYKTGDLASMDASGTISYHGRKDLEVKIRGQRINIAEIERAILQCEFVHSVVVEYPRSGLCEKKLVAVLCFKDSSDVTGDLFDGAQGLTEDDHARLLNHVSSILTPAMVPSKWLSLPYLPQMTSGKADRKQVRGWLEKIDKEVYDRIFHCKGVGTPVLDTSDAMVSIWLKALKLEPQNLYLDKSFIRNGGDSIMAMEARHLAHQAGLAIDIRELLAGRTLLEIGQMVTATSPTTKITKIAEDKDEPFALSPVQQMYFDKIFHPSLGLQQRVCVELTEEVHPDMLRDALNHVIQKHRMLAARFTKDMGQWMQQVPFGQDIKPESFYRIYTEAAVSYSTFCTEPMSIEDGILLHAHLQSDSENPTLVLCVQHLVVDLVSWRIILKDLHEALVAAKNGAMINLPRPALTFQQWCREQANYAESLVPEVVLPFAPGPVDLRFWQQCSSRAILNTYGEVAQLEFRFTSLQTTELLDKFTTTTLHPTDVLLATFALAFKHVFPERETPTIFIEGHGREPWHGSLDISQTVGWFSAAYPMHLPRDTLPTMATAILAASERRQSVPANGHPYWAARYLSSNGRKVFGNDPRHTEMEFVFNYAGSVVQRAHNQELFSENVRVAEIGHPDCERFSLFDLGASIEMPSSELVVALTFSRDIAHRERVGGLMRTFHELLCTAIQLDLDLDQTVPSTRFVCPADVSHLLEINGVSIERDVEEIYTPSSIQQHMLSRQYQEPWFYCVEGTWTIEKATECSESIDMDRLSHAWNQVVHRHSTLRTVFKYSDEEERFVAIVLKEVEPNITILRRKTNKTSIIASCHDDELLPPHRMVLREMDDGSVICNLEFSHTIIDAASRSIVMQDFADAYEGNLTTTLDAPPFWEYVRSIRPQSSTPSTQEDLPLAGRVVTLPFEPTDLATNIPEACKTNEITVSSFFMAAWSTVLAKHMHSADVSSPAETIAFDYVLSDRPEVPGIENAVGPYIRLPTCETHVHRGISARDLARDLHAQCTSQSSSPSQDGSLDIDLPSKATSLQKYSTLVNIRNSGSDSLELVSASGDVKWVLQGFNDPWDYDLVFAVNVQAGRVLGWTVEYVDGVVEDCVAEEIAEDLKDVVGDMVRVFMEQGCDLM
ncbi:uncharacterized protein DSM5745_07591 [Aspergillus mulundensis]|uniref:Carrier domain-containing protein n=1 Tax=Aspergillus mulundensis TaxID=1810919 RepID=A0A3D8REF0_9EURO|nr:Uncharacterized protein DSM5745_07591 [Aspergillus mulundensis]RDW72419.1 Uncharacterized protein DSM5745_07591 [Aspergillus mulundensis]